jgi:hypothetical protein
MTNGKAGALSLLALGLVLVACDGGVVVPNDGGGGAGGAGDTSTSTSVTTSTSQGVGGFDGDLVPTIENLDFGADCMPVVGPDPIHGAVTVRYDNAAGAPQGLTLTQANVIFTTPMEGWVFPITLSPTVSGDVPPHASATVVHEKVATVGDSSSVCQLCGMSGQVTLDFVDTSGNSVQATAPFDLGCAF